jgi:hypothetical protein
MATLYISEYPDVAHGASSSSSFQVAPEPPLVEQTVAISASVAASSAFGGNTRVIRVNTDATCSILVGSNPTATTAKKRLPADTTEYFGVQPGDKISVIANS